ncbi:MAG TPA: hypothetical protein VN622_01035 [Clostridia bacterium]|nr:hypothetical protein [Clostridia bacterium]
MARTVTTRLSGYILLLLALFSTIFTPSSVAERTTLDNFSKCLAEKNAVMYGAFWCEHCKEQKDLFGSSFRYVRYTECAVKGAPRQQTDICRNLAIVRYPTWIFADNERREGPVSLKALADKTGCKLP